MRQKVVIEEIRPIKKIKHCLIGVPGIGLVGVIASSYIARTLNMKEVGYFESDLFPPIIVVHEGNPKPPIRIYNSDDLAIITSEIPLPPEAIFPTARTIIKWAQTKNIELLISLTGIAVQNRLEIEVPAVYGVGTTTVIQNRFKDAGVASFEEGFMSGLHAIIIQEAIKNAVPNMILLAQSHHQYPDPAAAVSIIKSIKNMLDIEIDIQKLLSEAEEIRLKTRELMLRTQSTMQKIQKEQEQEIPGMYV